MHLYVHVPFCARRCSYCDFAIAVRREVPSKAYVDAVLQEWSWWRERPHGHDLLDTLYFGGGTPSHIEPAELARLIAGLTDGMPESAIRETTLEANPDDVTPERASAWAAAGIDRVSLGAQSFDPEVLVWMHRTHASAQIGRAVDALREAGIQNISLDLIYALPAHLKRDWSRDLDLALSLAPDHLSLYGLTVEPHTPLSRWVEAKKAKVADDDRYADEFLLAHERLTAAGFEHYEVSNYGKPGRRAIHNSGYWQRRPFLGLGPSAHSGMGEERWWNIREYAAWSEAVGRSGGQAAGGDGHPPTVAGSEFINVERRRLEDLYLGLRTSDGLAEGLLPTELTAKWVEAGWAFGHDHRSDKPPIRLTTEGWLRLDALVAQVA